MNDTLQGVLAELAKGLGTNTGELWTWMQGEGVQAYGSVQVARLTVSAWGIGIAIAVVAIIALAIARHCLKSSYLDGADMMMAEMIPTIALTVLSVIEVGVISDLVGWMASPEGMVIRKALELMGR